MIHLRAIERKRCSQPVADDVFPFSVPAVRSLGALDLSSEVTFFVGENGSGKSTVLECIAAAASLPTVGSAEIASDASLAGQRDLARLFRLVWQRRTHKGFFLRAEDFFGFTKRLARMRAELRQRVADVEEEFRDSSEYAKRLAQGPANASLVDMTRLYGEDLDANSHGESFLRLFQARVNPGGLYLLDEPEAALSPQSQLGLLALLRDRVGDDCQFVVATHSPILLAVPGARIYSFDSVPVADIAYDELEHVVLTRQFLNDPERFLRHL